MGLCGRGATGVASVRSCQKLLPRLTEPLTASSKMNLPLAEAEPISDSGGTSGITYLGRSGGEMHKQKQLEARSKDMRETTLQVPRSVKEGDKVLQTPEQRFSCNPR